jgi:biotin carboxyl carrier protein
MTWQILINDKPVEIDPELLKTGVQVEPGVYSILVDGKSFEVRIVPAPQGWSAQVDGARYNVEVRDPRNPSRRSRAARGAGRQNIISPMPGKVIRVLVQEGASVEAGQGLVVVEAMKMQNELKASRPGRVVEVRVHDGDTVGSGETLVVLE